MDLASKASVAIACSMLVAGCRSGAELDPAATLASQSLEIQVDDGGRLVEVEYHILPDEVPAPVREAMARLHPEAAFTGAEREVNDGVLYWELSAKVGIREAEAMFTPDGVLHSEEIEVGPESIPGSVRDSVAREWAGGAVRVWEEIRDARRQLVEYHVKLERAGKKYKVMVSPDGRVLGAVREVVAEIEVPAAPR